MGAKRVGGTVEVTAGYMRLHCGGDTGISLEEATGIPRLRCGSEEGLAYGSWQTPHRFSPSRAGASSECQLRIALGASLLGQQGMAGNLAGYTGSRQQKPRGKTVNSCKLVSAMRHTKNCNDYVIYVLGYLKKIA